LVLSLEERIYINASKKLVELGKPYGGFMVEEIEVKEAEDFHINAMMFYHFLERARLLCDLILEEKEKDKCLLPIQQAETEMVTKLRSLFSK